MNNEKIEHPEITSLDDARLQFIDHETRKRIVKRLKRETRKSTKVVFKNKYAVQSKKGNSLILHIQKQEVPEAGLHITLSNKDLTDYLEDMSTSVPIYEIVRESYETSAEEPNQEESIKTD